MGSEPPDRNMITNSNLLIYGFLQNGQPVYITAPSSVTGTQIQLSPINYPTLNHLPDLSPMRMNNRFPESWANDPDFPPLPQMEDCNENLSAINPFAAEGIITNSMSQCSSPRQNHSPNTSKVQNCEKRSQSVNNAHQLLQKEYIPDYEIFPIAVKVSLNENGKQFPEDSKVFKFLTSVVGHKKFAFEIFSKIPKMVIHVDSNNTAEKLLSLNSICDQNVSIELQEKISRGVIKGIPKYLSEEEIIESVYSTVTVKSAKRMKRFNRESKILEDSLSVLITFCGNTLPPKVTCFGREREVKEYNRKVLQCFKCQKYGHTAKYCKAEHSTCLRCSSQHASKDCPLKLEDAQSRASKYRCINCKGNHSSTSLTCPERLKNQQILNVAEKYQVGYKRASAVHKTYAQALHKEAYKKNTSTHSTLNHTFDAIIKETKREIMTKMAISLVFSEDFVKFDNFSLSQKIQKVCSFLINLNIGEVDAVQVNSECTRK